MAINSWAFDPLYTDHSLGDMTHAMAVFVGVSMTTGCKDFHWHPFNRVSFKRFVDVCHLALHNYNQCVSPEL